MCTRSARISVKIHEKNIQGVSRKQSLPAGMCIFPKTFSPYLSIKLNTSLKNRLVSVFNEEKNKTMQANFKLREKNKSEAEFNEFEMRSDDSNKRHGSNMVGWFSWKL